VSILRVSGLTADGKARLRPEQRDRVERLNGLTSNLRVPTRTKHHSPPTNPGTRSLVGIAGKLTFPRRQRDVDGKIGYFRGIREIATQTQLLASKACSARADKCSRSSFSGRPTERETS
jgi:hypothetical protein